MKLLVGLSLLCLAACVPTPPSHELEMAEQIKTQADELNQVVGLMEKMVKIQQEDRERINALEEAGSKK